MVLEYQPGRTNQVADALSRKAELASLKLEEVAAVSQLKVSVPDRIREGLDKDPIAKGLMDLAREGKTRKFWVKDGLLMAKGERLYVPKCNNLRKELLKECHDTRWAGHPGQQRALALLEAAYYWPHMRDDVDEYVRTCLVCQQDKVERKRQGVC